MKSSLSIIVAVAENYAIGKNNQLIWHLPADLKHFKEITMGHSIIMGRKTFESIGKPLPGRTSIVISRNPDFVCDGCIVVNTFEKAMIQCASEEESFVIGGAQIYQQSLKYASKIYLTKVNHTFDADVFFPDIDLKFWEKISEEHFKSDEKNKYDYSFVELIRK